MFLAEAFDRERIVKDKQNFFQIPRIIWVVVVARSTYSSDR